MALSNSAKRNDLTIYENYADEWWDKSSPKFKSLQGITEFRLHLIRKWIPDIATKRVVDLGCGGGLLCSPLSKLGAQVIGVDISPASLQQAQIHSTGTARFICSDIRRTPLPDGCADVVFLADVLDHIPDYDLALKEARRLLVAGGKVYASTINRNILSDLLAVRIAENIGLVPRGTHDPKMFIRPSELEAAAATASLKVLEWQGELPAILRTIRNWAIHFVPSRSLSIAYSCLLATN